MKALIVKDCFVLWKQMKLFLVMVLVFSVLPGMSASLFAVVYAGMLPYTALAYDERSKWDQLAAMMPYSSRDLVVSKYLLGYLFIALTGVVTLLFQFLAQPFTHNPPSIGEMLLVLCAAALSIAITLPLLFRFGVEKGRMVFLFLVVGLSTFVVTMASGVADAGGLSTPVAVALPLAAAVLNAVSIPLSVRLYEKKNR